jgi:hypothetical protein
MPCTPSFCIIYWERSPWTNDCLVRSVEAYGGCCLYIGDSGTRGKDSDMDYGSLSQDNHHPMALIPTHGQVPSSMSVFSITLAGNFLSFINYSIIPLRKLVRGIRFVVHLLQL